MTTTPLDFDSLLPEGLKLLPFQPVGVGYALVQRRCFIADEMGLGKTWQALVAIEAAAAYPAVVVCPATLKGNWANEIHKLFPHRKVEVVGGRRPYETSGEIVVINYDLIDAWQDALPEAKALVLDESHYCKEGKTKRTKAALAIAARVPADGLVLLLTGTPLLNRPIELLSQLQILGQLEKIAPRPRPRGGAEISARDWEFAFKFRFCGPEHNGHGYEFKGSSNLDELNTKLRSTCYVRRMRRNVLNLSDTLRVPVTFTINGALKTYRQAEDDFLRYLKAEKGDDAVRSAMMAETLVRLNTLRTLAGEAKVEGAVEWVNNWLTENEGRKLVVFAGHISVQKALAQAFNAPTILGGQKDVEGMKARFNDGPDRVIVCSLQAAREGHTLVANGTCSDVLFVELPWHPGALQQAEDRVNRHGRTSDNVFAWQLLAADDQGETIDHDMAQLIEAKRAVFKAAADGGVDEVEESEIINEVIARFRAKAGA